MTVIVFPALGGKLCGDFLRFPRLRRGNSGLVYMLPREFHGAVFISGIIELGGLDMVSLPVRRLEIPRIGSGSKFADSVIFNA